MKLIPDFGLLLRSYRKQHGLTQQQVAARLRLSRNYISQIERGESVNLSFSIAQRILNLEEMHGQIQVTLTRYVMIDAAIAPEIVWLNSQGIETAGCCAGPPPTAMIIPSGTEKARELGYEPEYREGIGLFEITLKSKQRPYLRAGREPAAIHGVRIG